ncbi:putative inactive receptor kinase [Vitis vinifera]|uniref:Putative inactive receptor kinase n=1 Tax=Vitis vinifera TaxID=29760 RepID=A0A438KJK9_VITVI|nr:putative inactive receptor kinase [Vitis vinifera]
MISGDISIMQSWEATLEVLDLSSNKLTGSFPNLTSQFERLTTLKLGNNSLVGILPSGLGAYSRLSAVDLSSNNLNGPIPSSFFTSTTLTSLNLSGNNFVGSIPFQGSHESELLVLPSYLPLESLDLSRNFLTGNLPSDIGNMGRLKLLNLAKNSLSGELPNEISKLSDLEYLDLSSNNFRGEIPDKIPSSVKVFNVSHNDLSGHVPENLRRFPMTSFRPGNELLILPEGMPAENTIPGPIHDSGNHHSSKASIRVAIIVASVGAAVMIAFVLLAYYRAQLQDFHGRSGFSGQTSERDVKLGRFTRPSLFKFHTNDEPPATSLSFSNDHLLTSNSRSLSGQTEHVTEIIEHPLPGGASASSASTNPNVLDNHPTTSGRKSSPGSPLSSSPRFIEATEQHVRLDVYSPDRLAGELFFLDGSLAFTAEELSRAPAEVLGRSSHGTLYKATLDSGHMLTVKWLRVGLVKHKKEFAKEVKRIGSIRHPNVVPLRAYYWGPREQERLVLADYIQGDSLALHLYGKSLN